MPAGTGDVDKGAKKAAEQKAFTEAQFKQMLAILKAQETKPDVQLSQADQVLHDEMKAAGFEDQDKVNVGLLSAQAIKDAEDTQTATFSAGEGKDLKSNPAQQALNQKLQAYAAKQEPPKEVTINPDGTASITFDSAEEEQKFNEGFAKESGASFNVHRGDASGPVIGKAAKGEFKKIDEPAVDEQVEEEQTAGGAPTLGGGEE